MRRTLLLLFCCACTVSVQAQLVFDTVSTAEQLISNKLLGAKSGLIVKNVKYSGHDFSMAGFSSREKTGLIDEGIILSTGNVYHAAGPNQSPDAGVRARGVGDPDLQSIATGVVRDAAVLEFDLLALRDSIQFQYFFASEEYPEYVDKGVNDVFGFFIKEIGGKAIYPQNIARLPDGRTTVSIDNVNHRRNENYFLRSDYLAAHPASFWEQNTDLLLRASYFEFDGFTRLLTAQLKLVEGQWYHLKIAIGDVGDPFFDSAVFLKAKSMKASGNPIPAADSIVAEILRQQLPELSDLDLSHSKFIRFNLRLNFETDRFDIEESAHSELNKLVGLMKNQPDLMLHIVGHTDDVGGEEKNQKLSENRSEAVRSFLEQAGVSPGRISAEGFGESHPSSVNSTEAGRALNRRVEFQLSY